jgi:hypothetical protein
MFTITVTGIHQQYIRMASQTLSVPYSRLSQAMRNINRGGGKIVDVSVSSVVTDHIATDHSGKKTVAKELLGKDTSGKTKYQKNSPAAKKRKKW